MMKKVILLVLVVSLYACSRVLHCDQMSNSIDNPSDEIEIQELNFHKKRLSFKVSNKSSQYIYIPSLLNIQEGNIKGTWYVDNDIYGTSMEIPIEVSEINPYTRQIFTFEIPNQKKVKFDLINIHLLYANRAKKIINREDMTNITFLESNQNYLQEAIWILENCN